MFEILIGAGIALVSVSLGYAAGSAKRTGGKVLRNSFKKEMPDGPETYRHSPGTL